MRSPRRSSSKQHNALRLVPSGRPASSLPARPSTHGTFSVRSTRRVFRWRSLWQLFECDSASHVEVEVSSAGGYQPHELATLVQPAPQQDQPGLQVVLMSGSPRLASSRISLFVNDALPVPTKAWSSFQKSRPGCLW